MYDILCTTDANARTLSNQTTVFMMSHPLQAGQHIPCIRHRTHCIYAITPSPVTSHTLLYDINPTFCVISYELYITSHPILMSSHYSTYDITASIYETTSSMRATYTLNMWHHSHYLCHHTHCIDYSTLTLFMTSHSPHVWHPCIIQDITSSHIDLKPPFWGHHTHYIIHRVHCICVITSTLSQALYIWYHIQYMWDILSTIFMISYSLCMTTQPCELITPHSAYVWHHLHYRRRHIQLYHTKPQSSWLYIHFRHDITPPVTEITAALSLSSQPLHWYHTHFCMTSHPLYVWQHMHYI